MNPPFHMSTLIFRNLSYYFQLFNSFLFNHSFFLKIFIYFSLKIFEFEFNNHIFFLTYIGLISGETKLPILEAYSSESHNLPSNNNQNV